MAARPKAWLLTPDLVKLLARAAVQSQYVVSFPLSGIAALLFPNQLGQLSFCVIQEMRVAWADWWIPHLRFGLVDLCVGQHYLKPILVELGIRWLTVSDGILLLGRERVPGFALFAFE